MKSCFVVLIVGIICITVLCALFMILLAMPKSKFRSLVLEILSWFVAGAAPVLIISPLDFLPDPIFFDDILYLAVGIAAGVFAYRQRQQRLLDIHSDGDINTRS